MLVKSKTEIYIISILIAVGVSLVIYFFIRGNYFDLIYGIILLIYGIKCVYIFFKKNKGYLQR